MSSSEITYHILLGLYLGYTVIFACVFTYFRNVEPIKSRGRRMSLLTAFLSASFFVYFTLIQVQLSNQLHLNCDLVVWFSVLFLPLWAVPYILRGEFVIYKYWLNVGKMSKEKRSRYVQFRRRFPTTYFHSAIYFAILFLFFLIAIIIEYTTNVTKVGDTSVRLCLGGQIYVVGVEGIIFIVSIGVLIVLLWRAKDAYSIRSELLSLMIIAIPIYILFGVISILPPINSIESTWFLLIILFTSINTTIVFPLFIAFRQRNWAIKSDDSKSSIQRLPSALFSPEDYKTDEFFMFSLQHEALLESFKNFAVESWCIESLLFYLEILSLNSEEASLLEENEKNEKVNKIIKEFIILGSPLEVNIDGSTRTKILDSISAKDFRSEIFDEAQKVVFSQLRYDVFPKWLHGASFKTCFQSSGLHSTEFKNSEFQERKKSRASSIIQQVEGIQTMEMRKKVQKKNSKSVFHENTDSELIAYA